MKYYVVSESELEALKESWRNPDPRQHTHDQQHEAMEACRAREVIEDISGGWMEVGKR